MTDPAHDILDVAVVGGGVSGVYAAWRLMRDSGPATFGNAGARPRITVFEGSDRVGGRMLSVTPPGMPPHRLRVLALPDTPISSTAVREALARGADISPLVGADVAGYIASHRLYGKKP